MIRLEDEADFAAAQHGHVVFVEAGDVFAVQQNVAGGRAVQAGQQTQQRAFAAARWSHDGDELAVLDLEIDSAQNVDLVRRGLDALGEGRHPDSGCCVGVLLQFSIMALGEDFLLSCVPGAG